MNSHLELVAFTIVSAFIVSLIAFLARVAIDYGYDQFIAILLSFVLAFLASLCVILFIQGFTPFVTGVRIPLKAFLIIWPVCTVPLVPLVARRLEISGNVVIDSLLVGGALALFSAIMGTGWHRLLDGGECSGPLQAWLFLALFMGVFIRALIWALQ